MINLKNVQIYRSVPTAPALVSQCKLATYASYKFQPIWTPKICIHSAVSNELREWSCGLFQMTQQDTAVFNIYSV